MSGSTLERAIALLEQVSRAQRPVSLAVLTEELGLPKTTVHRVLQQMEERGLVRRDMGRDRYVIGARLSRLAFDALKASFYATPGRSVLEELVNELGETCNIGVLEGRSVVYIDRVECNWPLRLQEQSVTHRPAHCTAIGKLLMAYRPARARQAYLQRGPLQRFTENTVTDPDALESDFKRIRAQGYAVNDQEYQLGLIGIAVPVMDEAGEVTAGLALHAPIARLPAEKGIGMLERLRKAADDIARAYELK